MLDYLNSSITTTYNIAVIFILIFGSLIGSFLNVCIYRIPKSKSIIFPNSFCPSCNHPIPFYLNIPVISFLMLLGKCSYCKTPISIRYVMVELITAISAAASFIKFGYTIESLFWFVFICVLIVISFIDIELQIIPDILSISGIFIFSLSFVVVPKMHILDTLAGIAAGGGSLYLVAVIYYALRKEEGMGGGDIKLLAMIGAATGLKGVLFTIFTSSLLGTVTGVIIMIISKKADSKLKLPFGPYLALGSIIYIFQGDYLINWYFNMLS